MQLFLFFDKRSQAQLKLAIGNCCLLRRLESNFNLVALLKDQVQIGLALSQVLRLCLHFGLILSAHSLA